MAKWTKLINNDITFKTHLKRLPTKGRLVYEYNPLRNYRIQNYQFEYKGQLYNLGELYTKFGIYPNCGYTGDNNGTLGTITGNLEQGTEALKEKIKDLYSTSNYQSQRDFEQKLHEAKIQDWVNTSGSTNPVLKEPGELVDFNSSELKLSLEYPVQILPQYSYDGSVNLIINDGINIPRLINTRFSATGKNTYEIIDRAGNNDTNIYDQGDQFDSDTSLIKQYKKITKINLQSVTSGGNLKIGSYHFYFKMSDTDGNETDFIGESGQVQLFIGNNSYSSVTTGQVNQNCYKQVTFTLENLDNAYDYVIVYYSRSTGEGEYNSVTEYNRIDKKFLVSNYDRFLLNITGFEDVDPVTLSDINPLYYSLGAAKTMATCQNMLFFGNIASENIPYKELADLSLRFTPSLKEEDYPSEITPTYNILTSEKGYVDPVFTYNKTGYWTNEIYRLGVVYILPNGKLSPVFNIRGGFNITAKPTWSNIDIYTTDGTRNYINYDENTYYIIPESVNKTENYTENVDQSDVPKYENVKGVMSFKSTKDTNQIYSIKITAKANLLQELKKYVQGYFFVRQERIPLTLAQAITIGVDTNSGLPTIPTHSGVLSNLNYDNTNVKTSDIDGVNFISEGFLSRYKYSIVKDKKEAWKKGLKIAGVVATLAVATVATIATAGAALTAIAPAASILAPAIGGVLATTGAAVSAAATSGVAMMAAGSAIAGGIIAGTAVGAVKSRRATKYYNQKPKPLTGFNPQEIPEGCKVDEHESSRLLSTDFKNRIIIKDNQYNQVRALLCPDYAINQSKYNQIFTGDEFTIEETISQGKQVGYFDNDGRHFYLGDYDDIESPMSDKCKIISIPDNCKTVGLDEFIFRSRAGEAEEAWRYETMGEVPTTIDDKKTNSDIVRGAFGPYLGTTELSLNPATIVNIKIPGYNGDYENYFKIRMQDNSAYRAITDRISLIDGNFRSNIINTTYKEIDVYRGDCYICQFTQRINRNFNDPSAPYNDEIIDSLSWKEHYDPVNSEEYADINLGDVNAVPLGMWVTFRLRSYNNLNIRTLDGSNIEEAAMSGHERGYYPYYPMSVEGTYKIPDASVYNRGFTKNLSERVNFLVPDVPHIKNWFGTRIVYSDIHINDAFKNGFRTFRGTNYRDYSREFGEITKLIPFESSLLVIFEHGVALLPVNERAVAGQGASGNVYINTSNVLPENPKIISDMFGSQWPESVLKVPGKTGDTVQYVYGVDTVAKKIWRTDGNTLQCISDMRVQEFLNNNITLGERELTPKIGIRNVKTVYNAFKRDVLFTFYDNTYGFEEKVWNLCWNETLQKFITFYSWVPSYMENINNIPFSFNRDTSKWIAKLGTSHVDNSFADGITLTNNVINNDGTVDNYPILKTKESLKGFIGFLDLKNRILPENINEYEISYSIEHDSYGNYKMFTIALVEGKPALFFREGYSVNNLFSELYYRNSLGHSYSDYETIPGLNGNIIQVKKKYIDNGQLELAALDLPIFKDKTGKRPTLKREEMLNPDKIVTLLNIKATIKIATNNSETQSDIYYDMVNGYNSSQFIDAGYYESVVAIIPKWNMQFLSTDFWKHGQAGIIDIVDDIQPTYWYGKTHPFEFECVVVNDPSVHKIFTNLELIANKAKPESFHYEIIGETYDFAKDKPNMYFRQEAKKALWQYNGSNISYNRNFLKVQPEQQKKSADFPHKYYTRQDTINEIEDYYISSTLPQGSKWDYKHLSGAEIVYYPNRQEYRVWQHAPAINLNDLSQDDARSIISANCQYLEDRWKININPILICYKNESWVDPNRPPLTIKNSPVPNDALKEINKNNGRVMIPDELWDLGYTADDMDTTNWLDDVSIYKTSFGEAQNRKEVDVRDKFMKVRIRYSGEELAVINFLNTIYRVSYA